MSKRKLATYVHVNGTVYGPDDDVPADVAKEITNPKAWADGAASEEPTGPKAVADMNGNELKDEIARRNEGRDEESQIKPASKKKDDLLAALVADDAANA